MRKEMIYDMMNGFIDLEKITELLDMVVQNEFSDGGECEKIFRKVYNAKSNLGKRLGNDEDEDVEQIIHTGRYQSDDGSYQFLPKKKAE